MKEEEEQKSVPEIEQYAGDMETIELSVDFATYRVETDPETSAAEAATSGPVEGEPAESEPEHGQSAGL